MIVGVTAHRPPRFDANGVSGYDAGNPLRAWVRWRMREHLRDLRPLYAVTGMCIGGDQDFANVCVELRIPFIAAVPFVGQESRWPPEAQREYRALLAKAYEVITVCDGPYERWKMQARNEWVVDHINVLIAVFDGSPGGTANTVNYADRVGREKRQIDPGEWRRLRAAATKAVS